MAETRRGGLETTIPRASIRPLSLAALLLSLVLGCARGGCVAKAPEGEGEGRTRGTAVTTLPAPAGDRRPAGDRQSGPAAAPRPAAPSGKVVRIRDGDSVVVLDGGVQVEVRLHGVDAPELAQAFGRRAKRFAGDLAFGRQVELEPRGKDAYDRTLAEVILPDGRTLNRELVSAGLAWHYRKYSDDADLAAREREARAARRGLWADPAPVPPWEWREAHPRGRPRR